MYGNLTVPLLHCDGFSISLEEKPHRARPSPKLQIDGLQFQDLNWRSVFFTGKPAAVAGNYGGPVDIEPADIEPALVAFGGRFSL